MKRPSEATEPGIRLFPGQWRPHYPFEQIAWISPPWPSEDYVWLDFPEAIFANGNLLYLSHVNPAFPAHFPDLPRVEWQQNENGLQFTRLLPNGVRFGGSLATIETSIVSLVLSMENGSDEQLRDIRLQTCAYLRPIKEFAEFTLSNKYVHLPRAGWVTLQEARQAPELGRYRQGFRGSGPKVADLPILATLAASGDRLLAMTWYEATLSLGSNPQHPCMHADPGIPDLAPGVRETIRGELIFFEGSLTQFEAWFRARGAGRSPTS